MLIQHALFLDEFSCFIIALSSYPEAYFITFLEEQR